MSSRQTWSCTCALRLLLGRLVGPASAGTAVTEVVIGFPEAEDFVFPITSRLTPGPNQRQCLPATLFAMYSSRGVEADHTLLAQRLRTSGAVPPLSLPLLLSVYHAVILCVVLDVIVEGIRSCGPQFSAWHQNTFECRDSSVGIVTDIGSRDSSFSIVTDIGSWDSSVGIVTDIGSRDSSVGIVTDIGSRDSSVGIVTDIGSRDSSV